MDQKHFAPEIYNVETFVHSFHPSISSKEAVERFIQAWVDLMSFDPILRINVRFFSTKLAAIPTVPGVHDVHAFCACPAGFFISGNFGSALPRVAMQGTTLKLGHLLSAILLARVLAQNQNCTAVTDSIGDGFCDWGNNSPECGYDGGDCCACTCNDPNICGFFAPYDCQDPEAYSEFYNCQPAAVISTSCPAGPPSEWVVNDTISAAALANALLCSGGAFVVRWQGEVVLNRTMHIAHGTVLHMTGVDAGATVDGGLSVRPFTVWNASLYLSNIEIRHGSAVVGGAAAAVMSNLYFDHVSFRNNSASTRGGAIYAAYGSDVFWDGETHFYGNTVSDEGGAIYAYGGSMVSWSGTTHFSGNSVEGHGGALYIEGGCLVYCGARTSFEGNNAAFFGGAVFIAGASTAIWEENTTFSNNHGLNGGGAVYITFYSDVIWEAEASFSGNSGIYGGAVDVDFYSNVVWAARVSFTKNIGRVPFIGIEEIDASLERFDAFGGAVALFFDSTARWEMESYFSGNTADFGGAVSLSENCTARWGAKSSFINHSVSGFGGSVIVYNSSRVLWEAEASFLNNSAIWEDGGGAVHVASWSSAVWRGHTSFSENSAPRGGAISVIVNSDASWEGVASFSSNTAGKDGGAIFIGRSSRVFWEATTYFFNNSALGDGGAVYQSSILSSPSFLEVKGPTTFDRNVCGANGGGLAVIAPSSATLSTENLTFIGNYADVSGGAVFISGLGNGPAFVGAVFVSNTARVGGAIYVTGTGTVITYHNNQEVENPTIIDRCEFISNEAEATGGAMDSSAGLDSISNSFFARNAAGVGGALRLAGVASLQNCTFVENTSGVDGGPALSNIGYIREISSCLFADNVFHCNPGSFLSFDANMTLIESGALYDTVCQGCSTSCQQCSVSDSVPLCVEEIEHSASPGGDTTIETLSIQHGYWRASNTSTDVLACYNSKACGGGVTGSPGYCQEGYEGPYCSVCSSGYTASLDFTCERCPEKDSGVAVVVVLSILAVIAFLILLLYLIFVGTSRDSKGAKRILTATWKRRLMSLRIVIVAWQIITQFSSVANVIYPSVYQDFLDGINFLNFDLTWVLSTSCIVDVDVHDRMIMATAGPLVLLTILGATYLFARFLHRRSREALEIVRQKHLSMVLLLTFLVYSSVSSTLFQMFACDPLDDGKNYLRADYRIQCNSVKHRKIQVYAALMLVVYAVGIPALYAKLLFRNREVLLDTSAREHNTDAKLILNLWELYKPEYFYYELVECARRILLAGVVVFIYPNTASQVTIVFMIAVFFMFVYEAVGPYAWHLDLWVSRMGHAIVCLSMFLALLLKVDVTNERAKSQEVYETVLVVAHGLMVSTILLEAAVVTYYSWEKDHLQKEDANPRCRTTDKPVMPLEEPQEEEVDATYVPTS